VLGAEDEAGAAAADEGDRIVASDQVFVDGSGLGDGTGRLPETVLLERTRDARAEMKTARDVKQAAETERMFRDWRQTKDYEAIRANIRRMVRSGQCPTSGAGGRMPYSEVCVVFNHRNLWVNLQARVDPDTKARRVLRDPALIVYDMDSLADMVWLPFQVRGPAAAQRGRAPRGAGIVCHYTARSLSSQLASDQVAELQARIQEELDAGLVNLRLSVDASTKLAPALRSKMRDLLEAKERLEAVAKTAQNGWEALAANATNPANAEGGRWKDDAACLGRRRSIAVRSLTKALVDTRPPGYDFRLKFCRLNSADPLVIRKIVLDKAKGEDLAVYLHGTMADPNAEHRTGREIFAVAAKVEAKYNAVVVTRVGVMVVWPLPKSADHPHAQSDEKEGQGRRRGKKVGGKRAATVPVGDDDAGMSESKGAA
jgi:hypothetical protein